ncbi:hypothetical protein KJ693_07760 [bacterium]|nr:hypothetical protein [bacterium]MBU1615194.1 hypothetical protein [bacterium]
MNSPEIKEFICENSSLFWWIKEKEKENLSIEFLVEMILNYGDKKSVKKLFKLVGIDKVADIFYKQTLRRRVNYFPQVVNFFDLYFKKNAYRSIDR